MLEKQVASCLPRSAGWALSKDSDLSPHAGSATQQICDRELLAPPLCTVRYPPPPTSPTPVLPGGQTEIIEITEMKVR